MHTRMRMILFTLFAPVTVPAYLLFLAGSNLLGGAFYIVIEASLARLISRPISLSRTRMVLLAVPVLLAAPVAAAIHLVLALLRAAGRLLCWIGTWQTSLTPPRASFLVGAVWTLAAFWTSITCLNAAVGLKWIGQGISPHDLDLFVEQTMHTRVLGDMPEEMQARRRALIDELTRHKQAVSPEWRELKLALSDDTCPYTWLPRTIRRRLANIPWFFMPKAFSTDGLDHSSLLLGPLLFVWMLLIRWPGMFAVLRPRWLRVIGCLARAGGAVWAVHALVTWVPTTAYASFWFEDKQVPASFTCLSPAMWFGADYLRWARPEWYLFNAGLWLILAGLVVALWWLAWRVSPFLGWPRYYVAFLASRLLQRKRIAFFSVGAVTLCVAMMIIVISVMGGFVDSIRERANGLLGDLVVDGNLQGFPYYTEFIEKISKLRDEKTGERLVLQATPLIHTYGLLQFPSTKETRAVTIRGIRLDEYCRVNEFGKDLFYQARYGGTRLDVPMAQPKYGFGPTGKIELPGDMDRHYREEYLPSLPPARRAEEEKRYRRDAGPYFPGPGVFAPSEAKDFAPGFEGKPYPGVIIGRDVVLRRLPSGEYERENGYPRGEPCYLTVLPLTRTGALSNEPPPKPLFRYVDDSRTGIHEIDSKTVYVDFERLQQLLSMGAEERVEGGMSSPRCSQIQIKLNDRFSKPRDVLLEKKRLIRDVWLAMADPENHEVPADGIEYQLMNRVHISTWEEMQRTYIAAIEKEKFLVLIMFGVISIVAVFLILCIFYMIVQEKTRDVGIIKSVGASTEGVTAVFLAYGAAIGLVGCVIGALIGVTFVEHINEIQDWLARMNPSWRVWSPETYSFDKIPNKWKWGEVLWISVLAVLASIGGAAFPAIRAGRTWPVESLRYE
ncbi:MAG: FtsX-like permease family protein [Phycisphaerae bacterium]